MLGYFDTNIFDHLHKGIGATTADLELLKARVVDGRLRILFSAINLEEVVSAVFADQALTLAELQLIANLVDLHHIIKPSDMLLTDDIVAFANGTTPPPPLIEVSPAIRANLERMLSPTTSDTAELIDLAREVREQIGEFRAGMKQSVNKVRPIAKQIPKKDRPTFDQYWEALSASFAEGWAERVGQLHACRERGIENLLQLRSVRLSVGASLSLTYAHTFEDRQPQQGDSRDLHHAVAASAARVFVTNDPQFARVLKRVPVNNFSVSALPEFLASVT